MEALVCPECGEPLDEEQLAKSLMCPHCKTNLKDKKYMGFLEYLMEAEIVSDIDFFDESIFGDEYNRYEASEFDDSDLPEPPPEKLTWDTEEEGDEDWNEEEQPQW